MLALLGSILVPLVAAGLRSVLWALIGIAALALAAVGLWWTLAHTGVLRALGAALSVTAPVAVLTLYATFGMLGPALVSLGLWLLAVTAARTALAPGHTASDQAVTETPHAPWILMNARSGGGKVGRFHLVEKARATGCRVVLLEAGQDVAELARRAVAEGADLLAVAGGDGTQALVAEVAAHHDLPFVVIPAGTRNHFALDLGLDRDDPTAALEALSDSVELRIDLGYAADRVFVNNASFGTYASVVTDPAYRNAKARTTLRTLPGLLTGEDAPRLRTRADRRYVDGLQALLVSNNPYGRAVDAARPGRRERLDSGLLGVVCMRVGNTAQAARMVRGPRSGGLIRLSAGVVVVEADMNTLPVGIDGEHVVLPSPVVCRSAPGALRVRVPRHRPGTPRAGGAAADWPRVARLALGRLLPEGRRPRLLSGRPRVGHSEGGVATVSIRENFAKLFRGTAKAADGAPFAAVRPCRCSPEWPGLETTANGHMLPAQPSSHYSVLTNPEIGPFVARCTGCQARYPNPWVIPQGAPMPFDWARDTPPTA